jgi:ADP-L-glycero-D-manno-heptose 6-epimerase
LVGINWPAIGNIDAVIHLAANNDTLCDDEEEIMLANFYSSTMLFKHCVSMGCRKFVFASSAAVYGNAPPPQTEDEECVPLNPYGRSKLRFEKFAKSFAEDNGVSVVGLRYFNVYGPGEQHKGRRASMVYQIVRAVQEGRPVKLFKHGEQARDWIHVSDVVDRTIGAVDLDGFHIVNVGTGTPRSFNDIVAAAGGKVDEYIDCPFSGAYQSQTCASTKKAEGLFGPRQFVTLEQGVRTITEDCCGDARAS